MATPQSYEKAFDFLKSEGFEIYPPATKSGKCEKDYIVLKDDGTAKIPGISSVNHYYQVLCYSKNYSTLLSLVDNVKMSMSKYAPSMMPTGVETPAYKDDDIGAFMISVQYRASGRNKHL